MIANIYIQIILMIVIPDFYIDLHYLKHKMKLALWKRLIWWMPGMGILAFATFLIFQPGFAPTEPSVLNTFLFLLGLVVVPKFAFMICSVVYSLVCRLRHKTNNYGNLAGLLLVALLWYVLLYGSTLGFEKLDVRHVDYYSDALPKEFDGYKIVHITDLHVGSYSDSRKHILQKAVDSINAQKADAVMITGDLQNQHPQEIYPHLQTLSSIKAKDGVFSVMGNHDYADYIKADAATKVANCKETMSLQRQMGWVLLLNEHRSVVRGKDSIIIAGMENDGDRMKFPQRGDVGKTLDGVNGQDNFVVMLQHDPTCWRRKILSESKARLTLSGHTHAMQFAMFGWSSASIIYKEWGGLFYEGERAINVSTALGGFIPFRFGVPGEIVVITLHRK